MKLKINNVPGYSGTVSVKTDKKGIPLDKFWRRRLKDSKVDNCVEKVTKKVKEKSNDNHTSA